MHLNCNYTHRQTWTYTDVSSVNLINIEHIKEGTGSTKQMKEQPHQLVHITSNTEEEYETWDVTELVIYEEMYPANSPIANEVITVDIVIR